MARNLQSRSDSRSVTRHAGAASVGVTRQRNSGRKLGNRLRQDIVGEGPVDRNKTEFARVNDDAGNVFKPIDTGLSNDEQSAAFNNSGGRE